MHIDGLQHGYVITYWDIYTINNPFRIFHQAPNHFILKTVFKNTPHATSSQIFTSHKTHSFPFPLPLPSPHPYHLTIYQKSTNKPTTLLPSPKIQKSSERPLDYTLHNKIPHFSYLYIHTIHAYINHFYLLANETPVRGDRGKRTSRLNTGRIEIDV